MSKKNDEFAVLVDDYDGTTAASNPNNEKMFKVVIEEEEGQLNYAVIGVNGNVMQLRRGDEVMIPESFLKVLETAKATRLVKEIGPDGKTNYIPRDYATIPYRVLR
jgi:hypothetical protein